MDVQGITWVGNVFEKFEAMCLEVEEIIYEDTVKYMENQVQTVGESVKKFYSDVMQELLPPSSLDPEKISVEDLDLENGSDDENYRNPKVSKKGAGNTDPQQLYGDILCNKDKFSQSSFWDSAKGECSDLNSKQYCYTSLSHQSNLDVKVYLNKDRFPLRKKAHKGIPIKQDSNRVLSDFFNEASFDQAVTSTTLSIWEGTTCDPIEGSCNRIESTNECGAHMSNDSLSSNMLDSVNSVENEANEMRVLSSGGWSAELNVDNLRKGVACMGKSSHKEEEQQKHDAEGKILVSYPERSSESSFDAICANVVSNKGLETNEQTDNAKLEETCVMVNENEFQFLRNRDVKHKTFKKKIRRAFTSRGKSSRKQEYEQLAAWFGDEAMLEGQCGKALMPTTLKDLQKLPNDDSCESDWELL